MSRRTRASPPRTARAPSWWCSAPPSSAASPSPAGAGVQTRGSAGVDRGLGAKGPLAAFRARRDAAAILLTLALWLVGLALRPDFWAGLDNSFAMLTAFTEIGILCVGLTFVIAAGDI